MGEIKSRDILEKMNDLAAFNGILIPEFTYGDLRIDAIIIDTSKRWVRGFEIKVSRSDFLCDKKWMLYSQFCSSLSIVCPEGLIQKNEIDDPFGLLYVSDKWPRFHWIKRPKNFQKRCSMSWYWTYTKIIETEFRRFSVVGKPTTKGEIL